MPSNNDTSELSELEVSVLEFERRWWKYGGAKDHAIRERFDMSATSYFQILNSLLDNPAALASDPMLVKRLRRIRSTRQSERAQARVSR